MAFGSFHCVWIFGNLYRFLFVCFSNVIIYLTHGVALLGFNSWKALDVISKIAWLLLLKEYCEVMDCYIMLYKAQQSAIDSENLRTLNVGWGFPAWEKNLWWAEECVYEKVTVVEQGKVSGAILHRAVLYLACHYASQSMLCWYLGPASPIYCLQNSKVSNSLLAPSSPRIFKLEGGTNLRLGWWSPQYTQ